MPSRPSYFLKAAQRNYTLAELTQPWTLRRIFELLEPISKKWLRVQGKASRELKTERTR